LSPYFSTGTISYTDTVSHATLSIFFRQFYSIKNCKWGVPKTGNVKNVNTRRCADVQISDVQISDVQMKPRSSGLAE